MTFTINRKSWHYFLAYKLGDFHDDESATDENNICFYVRQVAQGVLLGALGCALFAGAAFLAICGLAFLVHLLINFNLPTVMLQAGGGTAGATVVALVVWGIRTLWLRHRVRSYQKPPSFIKQAYRSFKDKTCVRIETK
jgi:hypothetical protein